MDGKVEPAQLALAPGGVPCRAWTPEESRARWPKVNATHLALCVPPYPLPYPHLHLWPTPTPSVFHRACCVELLWVVSIGSMDQQEVRAGVGAAAALRRPSSRSRPHLPFMLCR